jgi:hypothetical protein
LLILNLKIAAAKESPASHLGPSFVSIQVHPPRHKIFAHVKVVHGLSEQPYSHAYVLSYGQVPIG